MNRETIEAICVPGGDTQVRPFEWNDQTTPQLEYGATPSSNNSKKGVCVNPDSCKLVAHCKQLVVYTEPRNNHMGKAIIEKTLFSDRSFLDSDDKFNSSIPSDWPHF